MLRELTVRQFEEWREYADLEPFDEVRADMRTADIVRTLLNMRRKKGSKLLTVEDCLLKFGPPKAPAKPATPDEARAQVRRTMDILMAIYNKPPKSRRGH